MENIERSILYLRGLIDGGGFDESSKEGRIFSAIADSIEAVFDEIALMHLQGNNCEGAFDVSFEEKHTD